MQVAVVVVVIPILVAMPTMIVLIPPAVLISPTALARLVQLVPPMFGLPAPIPVMLNGLMQPVVGVHDAVLARALGAQPGRRHQNSGKAHRGKDSSSRKPTIQTKSHTSKSS